MREEPLRAMHPAYSAHSNVLCRLQHCKQLLRPQHIAFMRG